jgi:hypothetical protein
MVFMYQPKGIKYVDGIVHSPLHCLGLYRLVRQCREHFLKDLINDLLNLEYAFLSDCLDILHDVEYFGATDSECFFKLFIS